MVVLLFFIVISEFRMALLVRSWSIISGRVGDLFTTEQKELENA